MTAKGKPGAKSNRSPASSRKQRPPVQEARVQKVLGASEQAQGQELKEALALASGGARRRKSARSNSRQLSAKERRDLRGVVIYLDEFARKQLARLALDEDRTTQELGVEAINLLFDLYGLPEIA